VSCSASFRRFCQSTSQLLAAGIRGGVRRWDASDISGSVVRSGWFRDANHNRLLHANPLSKRHIGSLARLGWLPGFRSSRYSRSGRASPAPLDEADDDDEKTTASRSDVADARITFAASDHTLYN